MSVDLGISAEGRRAALERFRTALERAEITLESDADGYGPSPLRQAFESMGRSAAAASTIGTLSQLGILSPLVSASVDMAIDHERAVERRTRFLPQLEPEPLRRGPNGGIVLPLFGGVELPPFVRGVSVTNDYTDWSFTVELRGERAGHSFLFPMEYLEMWRGSIRRASELERHEVRLRFLRSVAHAVECLERDERSPGSRTRRRQVFLQNRDGDEVELTDQVVSLGFEVPGPSSREVNGWADRVQEEGLKRSKELLLSCLSPDQRREFKNNDCAWFTVAAPSGKKYRIESSHVFNVKELETGTWYCAQPADSPPLYDCMLAQKLWLETDEEAFLKAANVNGSNNWVRELIGDQI